MKSIRPLVRSILISTLIRSPAAPGAIGIVVQLLASDTPGSGANARKSCALPSTMSEYATYSRLLIGSNAGTGYDPGALNCLPEMLKQYGGKRQTGLLKAANWTGGPQLKPRSGDSLTYMTVPFPP